MMQNDWSWGWQEKEGQVTNRLKKHKLFERLINLGLAESEAKAKALVMAGQVVVNDQRAEKAGQPVSETCVIRIKGQARYVSRGGIKLEMALKDFSLDDKINNDCFKAWNYDF